MQIAVVADPHYHDVFGWPEATGDRPALRSFADSMASTRIFNESYPAFRAVLDDIVQAGISIVVIVGDLTDDGQATTVRSVDSLLADYTDRHGLRFYMTPGNHDLFALNGRHQSKRFLNADGSTLLVTSDPDEPAGPSTGRLVTAEMHCGGYADGLAAYGRGFFRRPGDLHWESPFGSSDALSDRRFLIRSDDGATIVSMIDASYLVEPVPGLWLLSLDANVFEPRNGSTDPLAEASYYDSSNAGWNAVLKHKRFLFDWAGDVSRRARQQGKHLLAFSHYPLIDPHADSFDDELAVFGQSSSIRRSPRPPAVAAGVASGIGVHFSGHLHVNGTTAVTGPDGFLVNVAVPSLVAYPAAYKRVRFEAGRMAVETVAVDDVPGYDIAFAGYRHEAAHAPRDTTIFDRLSSYADFCDLHLRDLVRNRYALESPPDLAGLMANLSVAQLAEVAGVHAGLDPTATTLTGSELMLDWYRLRKARELALPLIPAPRLALYRDLCARFRRGNWPADGVPGRLAAIFRILETNLGGLPSDRFVIDLNSGRVTSAARSDATPVPLADSAA
jgi:3',5'-cyclic AMP phosphodiesterase CpdA